jgi:hypothetical protein
MNNLFVLKEGINTVHKNWQLLIIQFLSLFLSCISFFVIVGIPVVFAFVILGIDLTEVLRYKDIIEALRGTTGLFHKYFGMAIVILLSLFLYLFFVLTLWIFVLGGTIGVLRRSILDINYKLNFKSFYLEGKSFFIPVFFFTNIIGIIFIICAFILGFLGGAASNMIESAKGQEFALSIFLGIFFSLLILSVGVLLIIFILSVTVYGMAYLSFNPSKNPFHIIKETLKYIYEHPSSLGFYAILLVGYVVVGFLVILIASPVVLIPVVGPFLSVPFQIFTYAVQVYVGLIILSAAFHYYKRTGFCSTDFYSSGRSDIFPEEGKVQGPSRNEEGEIQSG